MKSLISLLIAMLMISGCVQGSISVIAYPAEGQNLDQQEQDEQECREWAEKKVPQVHNFISFDSSISDRLDAAYTACMESRGYTVR